MSSDYSQARQCHSQSLNLQEYQLVIPVLTIMIISFISQSIQREKRRGESTKPCFTPVGMVTFFCQVVSTDNFCISFTRMTLCVRILHCIKGLMPSKASVKLIKLAYTVADYSLLILQFGKLKKIGQHNLSLS